MNQTTKTRPDLSRAEKRWQWKHRPGGIRNKQLAGNPSMQHWPHPTDPKDPGRDVIVGGFHDVSRHQRAVYDREVAAFAAKYPLPR